MQSTDTESEGTPRRAARPLLFETPRRGTQIRPAPLSVSQPDTRIGRKQSVVCQRRSDSTRSAGTGKTTTLVEAINETLRRESQVLVCAQSNMAVDWISEKLTDRGIHVLRLGNPTRVNDKMLSFTYERRFESHPDYPDLWSIRKSIRELQSAKRRGSDQWHQKMDRLRSRATELEIRINEDLFNSAHVIASTLVGSSSRLLEGKNSPHSSSTKPPRRLRRRV